MANQEAISDCNILQSIWPEFKISTVLNAANCCLTTGVTCSNGRITELIPRGQSIASGSIPPLIGRLTGLTVLDFGGNNLTGPIPPEIGNLKNLKALSFYQNQLTGNIPSELGNLSELIDLNLFNNSLSGSIPSQLGNLKKLNAVNFKNNALIGPLPNSWSLLDIRSVYNCTLERTINNSFDGWYCCDFGDICNNPLYSRPKYCGKTTICPTISSEGFAMSSETILGLSMGVLLILSYIGFVAVMLWKKKEVEPQVQSSQVFFVTSNNQNLTLVNDCNAPRSPTIYLPDSDTSFSFVCPSPPPYSEVNYNSR